MRINYFKVMGIIAAALLVACTYLKITGCL